MEKKYRIGLFAAFFLMVSLISAGYRISYDYVSDRQQRLAQEEVTEKEASIAAEGEAKENQGYYLKLLEGYVAVYYQDRKTLYELTDIPSASLPDEVQNQLREGKYVENDKELYGFLENYSS